MGRLVKLNITLAGRQWNAVSHLVISQRTDGHNIIELKVPAPGESPELLSDASRDWIGKELIIQIDEDKKNVKGGSNKFRGIVADTGLERGHGGELDQLIVAFSPGILLDGAPRCRSFSNKKLSEIVKAVCADYTSVNMTIQSHKDPTISYIVQYRETDWQFLMRLADSFGEWIYDDGENLFFGRNSEAPAEKIHFGHDIEWFSTSAQTAPAGFARQWYEYPEHAMKEVSSVEIGTRVIGAPLYDQMLKHSEKMFPALSAPSLYMHQTEKELKEQVRIEKNFRSGSFLMLEGRGDNLDLEVGKRFHFQSTTSDNKTIVDHGFWIVTQISHAVSASGQYSNRIKSQAAFTLQPPANPNTRRIVAGTQVATVTDNEDPDKMGRVRVQYKWQENTNEKTPWIRFAWHHAGKDRGFYFVPEIGDEVLVGFENEGNPDCPFVFDTLYHGKNRPEQWADKKNNIKAIRTRGSNEVIFCDEADCEWIHLHNIREGMAPPIVENTLKLSLEREGFIIMKNEKRIGGSKQTLFSALSGIDSGGGLPVSNEISLQLTGDGKILIRNEKTGGVRNEICLNLEANGKITIETPKGDVEIKAKNVRVEAKEELKLKAKEIQIEADKDIRISTDTDIKMKAGGEIVQKAPLIRLN